jgi:hypothetical protein
MRQTIMTALGLIAAAVLSLCAITAAPASAAPSSPAHVVAPHSALTPRGYVSDGNLRTDPTIQPNNIIVEIYNQWVDINCWIDAGYNGYGSYRWFQANYYGHVGYLSAGVVSNQPSVGHC